MDPKEAKEMKSETVKGGNGGALDPLENIRERAFALYLERQKNGTAGTAESDWLAAETEMSSAPAAKPGAPRQPAGVDRPPGRSEARPGRRPASMDVEVRKSR